MRMDPVTMSGLLKADEEKIRNELKASGIELTDVPNGVIWKRV